ncbi:MAG: tetratricopeptide repeat protein [Actinomycetota bacterium]|nr:tetratricopeptide repeat protein [Actinomycetota bacterium]
MRRFYPVLTYTLLALLVPSLVAALFGTCASGLIFEGTSCSLQRDVSASLTSYGPWVLLVTLGLLVLTLLARWDHLRHGALQQFALMKPAESLEPGDLGFEAAAPGGSIGPGRRPFYEAYVGRSAATEPPDGPNGGVYDEAALAEELRSGRGFVLLGQPLDGKSRTLYQVLSGLKGRRIVGPSLSRGLPDDDALSLVEGEAVILLLEDLHEYAGARVALPELHAALTKRASSCVVAATCRDGPELRLVEEKLGRFYEDVPLKLKLVAPTGEEKGELARGIGEEWDPDAAEDYPTLGSIAMEGHLEAMSLRFRNLLRDRPDHADVLRAMKLLTAASVGELTHRRLEAVLKEAFGRDDVHLGDSLRDLSDQAFLKRGPSPDETAYPEPAYLRDAVSYTEGKEPRDDFFPALLYAFRDLRDADALISLGVTSMIGGRWNPQSVYWCFDLATEIEPDNPSAWLNKAALLGAGKHHEDAIAAAERAVELKPYDYSYWQQKGRVLHGAGRNAEARDAYLRASALRPDRSDTWRNLGDVYMDLGNHRDALRAFNRSIDLGADYDYVRSWVGRAAALRRIGRHRETLRAYDRIISMDPEHFETWFNKSGLLRSLSRHEDALVAAVRAEDLRPDHVEVHVAKCESLIELAKQRNDADLWDRALEACDHAIGLDQDHGTARSMKGTILALTGRFEEALVAIESAIRLRPGRVEEWWHKGQVLLKVAEGQQTQGLDLSYSAEYHAAMWWLCRAWLNRDHLPDRGEASVCGTFRQLGYDPRRCQDRYASAALART